MKNLKLISMRRKIIFHLTFIIILCGCTKQDDFITSPKKADITTNKAKVYTLQIVTLSNATIKVGGKIEGISAVKPIDQGVLVGSTPMPVLDKGYKISTPANADGTFSTTHPVALGIKNKLYIRAYAVFPKGNSTYQTEVIYGNDVIYTPSTTRTYEGNILLDSQEKVNDLGSKGYTTIIGSITVGGTASDLTPLYGIEYIDKYLYIEGSQISNLKGLEKIETLECLAIKKSNIQSLQGLNNLKNLSSITIDNCDALFDFTGLGRITESSSIRILNCDNLQTLKGFDYITKITNYLEISNNNSLSSTNALNNLKEIVSTYPISWYEKSKLIIKNNRSLITLDGFSNLTYVNEVYITNNYSLTVFKGFDNITSVDLLSITYNNQLSQLSGFKNTTTISTLNIENNNKLESINCFANVKNINYLNIYNNEKLAKLAGLENIQKLVNLRILNNNSLASLDGLEGLTQITDNMYAITIIGNYNLKSIAGLSNLKYVGGDFQIISNPLLFDFCPLKKLLISSPKFDFVVMSNGKDISRQEIITQCP